MSKNIFKVLAFVLLICLCFLTGCSGDVQDGKGEAFIRFDGQQGSARALSQFHESQYKIEDMYWTYVAVKTDGLYTEGESVKADSTHVNPGLGSDDYVERPVKSGPATGLDADVGPFATGDWKITLYGYVNCVVESGVVKFKNLIYKSAETDVKVIKLTSSTVPVVPFVIDYVTPAPTKGIFKLNPMFITVPEYTQFFDKTTATASELPVTDSVLEVDLYDVTGTRSLIAKYVKTLDSDLKAGDIVPVVLEFESPDDSSVKNVKSFEIGSTPALKKFEVVAKYKDRYTVWASDNVEAPTGSGYAINSSTGVKQLYNYSGDDNTRYGKGYAPVGKIVTYNIQFKAGEIVTLSGDVNDVADLYPETEPKGDFGVAVAKILKSDATTPYTDASYDYYSTLSDAFADYSAEARPVILLRDAGNEAVTLTDDVEISNPDCYSVRNLWLSGDSDAVFSLGSGGRTYKFRNGMIVDFSCDSSSLVDIRTSGGELDVTAEDDTVQHTGTVADVTLNCVSSYNLGADVTGTFTLAEGNVEICEYVTVETLNVTADSSSEATVKGTLTSSVGNMTAIRDGGTDKGGIFKTITLHSNLTSADTEKEIYGIDGMYIVLPDFRTGGASSGSALFENGQLTLAEWNTENDGSGSVYLNEDKIAAGSSTIDLYVQWSLPIGGAVYYIDAPNGASYTFFDVSGLVVAYSEDELTPERLASAFSYAVRGKSSGTKDRFYVFNEDLINTCGGSFSSVRAESGAEALGANYNYGGKTYSIEGCQCISYAGNWVPYGVFPSEIGHGKDNTEYILNIGSAGKTSSSWKSASYNTALWTYIKGLRSSKSNGCDDWYIPSAVELGELADFHPDLSIGASNGVFTSTLASVGLTYYSGILLLWVSPYGVFKCGFTNFSNLNLSVYPIRSF